MGRIGRRPGARAKTPRRGMTYDDTWQSLLRPGRGVSFFDPLPAAPFVPVSTWSLTNAWWLAELSRWIYRADAAREADLERAGLVEHRFLEAASIECSVVSQRARPLDLAIVVFRGTTELGDWLYNLRALPRAWHRGGLVHEGFQRGFQRVWHKIVPVLAGLRGPFFYTGHSLGGALATLASSERPPVAAYTFGSPRVGNAEFVSTLERVALHRVVHDRDLVAEVPPTMPRFEFRHAGTLHQLTRDGRLLSDPTRREIRRSRESHGRPRARKLDLRGLVLPPRPLSDHAPINYVARLRQLAQRESG